MAILIIYAIAYFVYLRFPVILQILVLIANGFVADPIPLLDEVIMFLTITNNIKESLETSKLPISLKGKNDDN